LAEEIDRVGIGESEFRLKYLTTSILSNHGDYNISFEPIVAINENSAKPHATPSNLTLKRGHLLLVDAGLKYDGGTVVIEPEHLMLEIIYLLDWSRDLNLERCRGYMIRYLRHTMLQSQILELE